VRRRDQAKEAEAWLDSRATAQDACWWQRLREPPLPASKPDIFDPPAQVDALRTAVAKLVPAKRPGRNLLIGTWNVRAFGDLTSAWRSSKDARRSATSATSTRSPR
jgi:hypothetical protein